MTLPSEIAVVDVETTGLFPGGADRIIEIGIVRMSIAGAVLEEYATLVNPGRDVGRTDIHGIRAGDLLDAPTFADVLGDVCHRINGAIVGGHNVTFDARFLQAEFERAGHVLPGVKLLCSMRALGGSLETCCRDYGIVLERAHSALHDARAAARLIACLLEDSLSDTPVAALVTDFGIEGPWPSVTPRGTPLSRCRALEVAHERRGYLAQLVGRLPAAAGVGTPAAFGVYYGILDRILEDRRVSDLERDEVEHLAAEWGLSSGNARDAHVAYLSRLVTHAQADGVVTDAEAHDLREVADLLGIEVALLEGLLAKTPDRAPSCGGGPSHALTGKSVCFTGQMCCCIEGRPVTRERAEELAADAGLIVLRGVTRKLDVLVLADPDSQSGKAKKARAYGTRLMGEIVFWNAIGVPVDLSAGDGAGQRQEAASFTINIVDFFASSPAAQEALQAMSEQRASFLASLSPSERVAEETRAAAEEEAYARLGRDEERAYDEALKSAEQCAQRRSDELDTDRKAGTIGTLTEIGRAHGLSAVAVGRILDNHGLRERVDVQDDRFLHPHTLALRDYRKRSAEWHADINARFRPNRPVEAQSEGDQSPASVLRAVVDGFAVQNWQTGKEYWIAAKVAPLLAPHARPKR